MSLSLASLSGKFPRSIARRLASAIAVLSLVTPVHADDHSSYLRAGNRLYDEGKFIEAEEQYIQAMNDKPDSAVAYFNIGDTYFTREDYPRAIEHFQSALSHARADRSLELRARYNLATARVKESERTIEDVSNMEKVQTGVEFLQQAISDYRDVLEIDPNHANARHNLSVAQLRIKNLFDTLKKLQEQAEQDKEEGQSPVEILKELIAEEEGEIALTRKSIDNVGEAEKLSAQHARVDEASALAKEFGSASADPTSGHGESLATLLEKLESDPQFEIGAAEISRARKELSSGGSNVLQAVGDAMTRLGDKLASLDEDRNAALEQNQTDQEATRNKTLGFVQALRDRAAGKPPPQPPTPQGQQPAPPPPPQEPLPPEVAELFGAIADLTNGAAGHMDTALEKLGQITKDAPLDAAGLPLGDTLRAQGKALEELQKALEEAEKLPKEEKEQQQQQQQDQKQDGEEDQEKQDGEDEQEGDKEQEQKGEQEGEQQQEKEGEGDEQKEAEEEVSREQAEKLLRKFLERDARRSEERKERARQRGRGGIGRPDKDW